VEVALDAADGQKQLARLTPQDNTRDTSAVHGLLLQSIPLIHVLMKSRRERNSEREKQRCTSSANSSHMEDWHSDMSSSENGYILGLQTLVILYTTK
jgi:hypothetical protein